MVPHTPAIDGQLVTGHPGRGGHGVAMQILRAFSVVVFFITSSFCIYGSQLVGSPLALISPDWWHAWIDFTKQMFGILLIFITQWWTPLRVKISHDPALNELFAVDDKTGHLHSKFAKRAVVMSNHQLYTDWVYLWWIAFTSSVHGGIYIMLKASLKKVPVWGWGMQTYRFIFLDRKWATDQKTLNEGLEYINNESQWPAWLALFPEGTTFSRNGVNKSSTFAKKVEIEPPHKVLLPRATGLRHTLLKLNPTVKYLYDATIHYDGIPKGTYGEDFFTLRNMYLRGLCPKRVQMHWRRFHIADIPYQDKDTFEAWLLERWREKDAMLEKYEATGSFTNDEVVLPEVPMKLESNLQVFQIFSVQLNVLLIGNLVWRHLVLFSR